MLPIRQQSGLRCFTTRSGGGAAKWKGIQRGHYAMPFEDRYIWGIIAGIVRNFYDRVYG